MALLDVLLMTYKKMLILQLT